MTELDKDAQKGYIYTQKTILMKKLYTVLIPACAVSFVILMAGFGGGSNSDYPVGAPPGYTNSPGDGQNCSHCMGGTPVLVADWITSDIPTGGYDPGTTYNILVTATGDGDKGFELSPQDESGNLLGTLFAGTDSKLVGSGKYITHTQSASENPKSWLFQWKAPDPGVGAITFYACAAVGKLNTKITTMVVPQKLLGIAGQDRTALTVYPNPVSDRMTVSFTTVSPDHVTLDLLSFNGRIASVLFDENSSSGNHTLTFPINLEPGVYLLRLQMDGRNVLRKVVVQ